MRKVKFRAWLRHEKEMSEVLVLDNQEEKVFVVRKDGAAGWRMFAEIELVEYTGLKNKNGVEIYEGDIVDFWGRKFLVVYNLGGFGCFGLNEAWQPLGDTIYRPTTVIGNRYENPELLEGNQ